MHFWRILWTAIWLFGLTIFSVAEPNQSEETFDKIFQTDSKKIQFKSEQVQFKRLGSESKLNETPLFLNWRGTLKLTSSHKDFGGYSDLWVSNDLHTLIAISDAGSWFTAKLDYSGPEYNRLTNISKAYIHCILNRIGECLEGKSWSDAEGLTYSRTKKEFAVSFERAHRVLGFDLHKSGFKSKATHIAFSPDSDLFRSGNKSLEAITALDHATNRSKGTYLTFSERALDKRGHIKGWLLKEKKRQPIFLERHAEFDVTSIAELPNGDFLFLERKYRPLTGVSARLRYIKGENVKPNALLSGKVIWRAGPGQRIDNMEGLHVAQLSNSRKLLIYMISDNNFRVAQETLLMMFSMTLPSP